MPRARANRWIVSKHEATALTLPDDDDGSVVDEEGPWTEEEPPDRPPPSLEGPETMASEANKELRWSVGPQRTTGAS